MYACLSNTLPFDDGVVSTRPVDLSSRSWWRVSLEAKLLLQSLLEPNARQRITMEDFGASDWFVRESDSTPARTGASEGFTPPLGRHAFSMSDMSDLRRASSSISAMPHAASWGALESLSSDGGWHGDDEAVLLTPFAPTARPAARFPSSSSRLATAAAALATAVAVSSATAGVCPELALTVTCGGPCANELPGIGGQHSRGGLGGGGGGSSSSNNSAPTGAIHSGGGGEAMSVNDGSDPVGSLASLIRSGRFVAPPCHVPLPAAETASVPLVAATCAQQVAMEADGDDAMEADGDDPVKEFVQADGDDAMEADGDDTVKELINGDDAMEADGTVEEFVKASAEPEGATVEEMRAHRLSHTPPAGFVGAALAAGLPAPPPRLEEHRAEHQEGQVSEEGRAEGIPMSTASISSSGLRRGAAERGSMLTRNVFSCISLEQLARETQHSAAREADKRHTPEAAIGTEATAEGSQAERVRDPPSLSPAAPLAATPSFGLPQKMHGAELTHGLAAQQQRLERMRASMRAVKAQGKAHAAAAP